MHEVLVNRLGGLSLPRKSVVRLTDRPNMTLDVYRGRKTTIQQHIRHQVLNRIENNAVFIFLRCQTESKTIVKENILQNFCFQELQDDTGMD